MSTTHDTLRAKVDPVSTAFVWGPIELKSSSDEILCSLREVVEQGVFPLGETVFVTSLREPGVLALSPYRDQVEDEEFHSSRVGQTIRRSRGRLAIPVQHSGREPERVDLQFKGGADTGLTPGTEVFPFACTKSLHDGKPLVYLLTEEDYREIYRDIIQHSDESRDTDDFTILYWSEKVTHSIWEEEWLAVEIKPGTFDRYDIHSIPVSQVTEVLFDSSVPLFDNDWR